VLSAKQLERGRQWLAREQRRMLTALLLLIPALHAPTSDLLSLQV
jgi:hypothetical protein